jgi:transcriptional regulator with XRE-family HTH domain
MISKRNSLIARRSEIKWKYGETQESAAEDSNVGAMEVKVGQNLRRLREGRHLSLRALAEISGLAINTLSLIENGKSSPSVSTLQQLARALEIPISTFFETSAPRKNIAHIKRQRRPRATFEHGSLEDLGAGSVIQAVEPFVVTLEPQADSGKQEIVHTGYEFIYCLEGQIQYTIGKENYLLEPGDSLLFEAHLPHCWQNPGQVEARSILVMVPGDERDHPLERHFVEGST